MARTKVLVIIVIGLVLVGCGASEPEKADRIEDIVGTWQRVHLDGSATEGFFRFSDDGTYISNLTLEAIDSGDGFVGDYWFEGTQFFLQETGGQPDMCRGLIATYEIHLESSDNLKWVLTEDDCGPRASRVAGSDAEEELVEWERVP